MSLTFQPPSSSYLPNFWETLYNLKLNSFKLDSASQSLTGSFQYRNDKGRASIAAGTCPIEFNSNSFVNNSSSTQTSTLDSRKNTTGISIPGIIVNVNTLEDFKNLDKKRLLDDIGIEILKTIYSVDADMNPNPNLVLCNPWDLFKFIIISFADLKSYKFTYWFGSPVLVPRNPFKAIPNTFDGSISQLIKNIDLTPNINGAHLIQKILLHLASNHSTPHLPIFGISIEEERIKILTFSEVWPIRSQHNVLIAVIDSSYSLESPGWHIRNLLAFLSCYADADNQFINLLCLRGEIVNKISKDDTGAAEFEQEYSFCDVDDDQSILIRIDLGQNNFPKPGEEIDTRIVGWELNERGKSGPRMADLSSVLDSSRLMSQAVDLNVKLMKWRMWPDLDTEKVSNTKVLLIGAGTLGCAVARALLGWGVRSMTFVDNGRVSYSNPARQCLFEFEDAVQRSFKATAAAERVRRIFPGVSSRGEVLSIPMPGHPLQPPNTGLEAHFEDQSEAPHWVKDFDILDSLIQSHDVIFTLTDSREARWLPTVMAAAYGKVLINVALGFDSYLVMRHGIDRGIDMSNPTSSPSSKLGCYFCSDIVAATNSQKDRTLDQQCTVTRPGLSFIAAGMAVEMMVALLHHHAHCHEDQDGDGDIPHQIRGNISTYTQYLPKMSAFGQCIACSKNILDAFLADKVGFVYKVSHSPELLEETSGISDLIAAVDCDLCIDSDEEF